MKHGAAILDAAQQAKAAMQVVKAKGGFDAIVIGTWGLDREPRNKKKGGTKQQWIVVSTPSYVS